MKKTIRQKTIKLASLVASATALTVSAAEAGKEKKFDTATSTGLSTGQDRPNVLFILIDDLGWSDIGCYGAKFHETPNIDSPLDKFCQ